MKICFILFSLCLCVNLSNCTPPFFSQIKFFRSFKEKYSKVYSGANQELKALARFVTVVQKVNDYNALFDAGLVESSMDVNKFADFNEEQIETLTTGNIIPKVEFDNIVVRPRAVITVNPDTYPLAPASIDWKARGHVTPVRDQGYVCNSCWAFSALAALESHFSIYKGIFTDLSEQYLVDCNRNNETGSFGCAGGSLASAYMNIQFAPGLPTEEVYPYQELVKNDRIFPCRYNRSTAVGTTKGYGRIRPNDEETLERVVAAVGPVAFAMNGAQDSFLFYSSGILNDPNCRPGVGHSALIYGYGTARLRNGTSIDFWLCKNSWSAEWGDKGFFRIIRGRNMCGLTSYLIYPLV